MKKKGKNKIKIDGTCVGDLSELLIKYDMMLLNQQSHTHNEWDHVC